MKIYTELDQLKDNEKNNAVIGTLPGSVLVDIGAHDCMVEMLELMEAIEKDNKKLADCWRLFQALTGTALMRLECKLRPLIEKAAAEGEVRQPT